MPTEQVRTLLGWECHHPGSEIKNIFKFRIVKSQVGFDIKGDDIKGDSSSSFRFSLVTVFF